MNSLRIWGVQTGTTSYEPVELPLSQEDIADAEAAATDADEFGYHALYRDHGVAAVIDAAYKQAKDNDHAWFKKDRKRLSKWKNWRGNGLTVLASMPEYLLKTFLGDGILHNMRHADNTAATLLNDLYSAPGDDVSAYSEWMQRSYAPFAPCIYTRELTDKDGNNPTPNELSKVIELFEQYASGKQSAVAQSVKLDNVGKAHRSDDESIEEGLHYFFHGVQERVFKLHTFCHALAEQISKTDPLKGNKPFRTVFKYVGFASRTQDRFKDYSADHSQSWLTEMMRDALRLLSPHKSFNLENFVICYLTSHDECQLAEELLTRSGRAYYHTGLGLNVHDAGLSNASGDTGDMREKDVKKLWKAAKRFRNDDDFYRRVANEVKRLEPYTKWAKNNKSQTRSQTTGPATEREELEQRLKDLQQQIADTPPLPQADTYLAPLRDAMNEIEMAFADDPESRDLIGEIYNAAMDDFTERFAALDRTI